MLIAAHALHERAILVTRNRDEFARVEGLTDRKLGKLSPII